jgi:NAD-dependent SIR2 family protein deacetylase
MDFEQVERGGGRTHETDRVCTFCGAALLDTIIHFSESYRNDYVPVMALHHAVKADVAIVMGTSMNVQGAASYPVGMREKLSDRRELGRGKQWGQLSSQCAHHPKVRFGKIMFYTQSQDSQSFTERVCTQDKALRNRNGKLYIVNLQRTPYDHLATTRVYARTDPFMEAVCISIVGLLSFFRLPDYLPLQPPPRSHTDRHGVLARVCTHTAAAVHIGCGCVDHGGNEHARHRLYF